MNLYNYNNYEVIHNSFTFKKALFIEEQKLVYKCANMLNKMNILILKMTMLNEF